MDDQFARKIIDNFPYPIASSFIKLRTDECLDPGPLRLKYILSTAECISCFLSIIVLCECRELSEKKEIIPSIQLGKKFSECFRKPAWGHWISFLREGLKWLHDNKLPMAIPELYEFYFKKDYQESDSVKKLNELLTIRNKDAHLIVDPTYKLKGLCEKTYPLLVEILGNLEFLLNYDLIFISRIEAFKKRRSEPEFKHHFKKIIGNSDAFSANREIKANCLDSMAIVMMNLKTKNYINLDPLIIYEEPDIFFYYSMNNLNSVTYRPCKYGEEFEIKNSSRSKVITEELQHIISLFESS